MVLLLAFTVPPVDAAGIDQCVTDTNARIVCVAVPIASPDPRVPIPPTGAYVFISAGECTGNPTGAQCHRVIYQETNNCPGLQRFRISGASNCEADKLLVI